MLLDQALLIATSDTELQALALTVILATSSERVARKEKYEAAELRYLTALMTYEKAAVEATSRASFNNILKLLDQDHMALTEPALSVVWRGDDAAFRNAILRSLGMRLTEICA